MIKNKSNQDVLDLEHKAKIIKDVAEHENCSIKNNLIESALILERLAKNALRKNAYNILELELNASDKELREARLKQAVKRGDEFYLPTSRLTAVGLPNIFLRSAVFSASKNMKYLSQDSIACQGDASIIMEGTQLIGYDRRMLAVCLNYYQESRPLASLDNNEWIRVTFYQLAKDLKISYGRHVHEAILKSLIRLNQTKITIRIERKNIPVSELIEVMFDENYLIEYNLKSVLHGSDSISFRVLESMANLYGWAKWSAVSNVALHDSHGLPAWIAGFYSTHAKPFELKITDLFRYSGSTCGFSDFHRRLKSTLTKLQKSEAPEEYRVSEFEINDTHVTVHLDRWQKKSTVPKDGVIG